MELSSLAAGFLSLSHTLSLISADGYNYFEIRCSWEPYDDTFPVGTSFVLGGIRVGDLSSQHLLVSYLPRDDPYRLSFDGNFGSKKLETSSFIKKCRARVVYKRDLEEFSRILKIPMPAVYGYDDEAGPIDSGSGSSDNDDEPISKRFKKV
ncbi:unnamed protein product [Prunus armeniaca]|uniref:Uncharacterized protein n=1 Tax=Prunus armeniaca TaxID=36596 RepID=A0A6J5Y2M1_PRUAR|nr:unnamed protein product [Prunus armeniaca]